MKADLFFLDPLDFVPVMEKHDMDAFKSRQLKAVLIYTDSVPIMRQSTFVELLPLDLLCNCLLFTVLLLALLV